MIQKISQVNVLDNSAQEELVVKDADSLTNNQNQTRTLSKEKLIICRGKINIIEKCVCI